MHRFSRSISALPIRLDKYLSFLDWTGRQLRAASQRAIPAQLAPILERLGIVGDGWIELHDLGIAAVQAYLEQVWGAASLRFKLLADNREAPHDEQ